MTKSYRKATTCSTSPFKHVAKRAKERLGIKLSKCDWRLLGKKIRSGDAEYLYKKTFDGASYLVELNGRIVKVIYDNARRCVVSIMEK